MTPGILLARSVTRTPSRCLHCAYPLELYSAQWSLVIGGVSIVPPCCSQRCSYRQYRGRGPIVEGA